MKPDYFEKAAQKMREFRQREQGILDKALSLFLEHGEEKVTVEMIAEGVGIGKGTIYKHFHSKYEIYMRLMMDYEQEIDQLLSSEDIEKDDAALAKDYFDFRMHNANKDFLFTRLEEKLSQVEVAAVKEMMESLYQVRQGNLERLANLIRAKIGEGRLEDVNPSYHYCAAWALTSGAVALFHSPFFRRTVEDSDGFFNFLGDVVVRLGNKPSSVKPSDDQPS